MIFAPCWVMDGSEHFCPARNVLREARKSMEKKRATLEIIWDFPPDQIPGNCLGLRKVWDKWAESCNSCNQCFKYDWPSMLPSHSALSPQRCTLWRQIWAATPLAQLVSLTSPAIRRWTWASCRLAVPSPPHSTTTRMQ